MHYKGIKQNLLENGDGRKERKGPQTDSLNIEAIRLFFCFILH